MTSDPDYSSYIRPVATSTERPEENHGRGRWLAYLLLFEMICFPTMSKFLYVREGLVLLGLLLVGIQAIRGICLDRTVVLWSVFLASVATFFGIEGLFLRAPGAIVQMELYAAWPLIYTILLAAVDGRILRGMDRIVAFSAVCVVVFVMVFFLAQVNIIPKIIREEWFFSQNELDNALYNGLSVGEGHVEFFLISISSLAFLVPYLIAAFSCRKFDSTPWTSRRWIAASLFVSVPTSLVSGRRALQLVTLLAPFLTLAFALFLPAKERKPVITSVGKVILALPLSLLLVFIALAPLHVLTFEGVKDRFLIAFDFSPSNTADNAVGRVDQFKALTEGWKERPFMGNGMGASAHGSIRDPAAAWNYELSYSYLLFEVGFIGFAAYTAGILWIYWIGIKIIRRGRPDSQFMLPALVGMSAVLIAHASNNYMRSFDTLWQLFLPLAFINCWLIANHKRPWSHAIAPA